MLSSFWQKAKQVGRKALGTVGKVVRKIGQIAVDNHQPLALALHGIAHSTGNETFKNIGNAALVGSGVMTGLGVGRDDMRFRGGPTG
jgi:hypothetical protein